MAVSCRSTRSVITERLSGNANADIPASLASEPYLYSGAEPAATVMLPTAVHRCLVEYHRTFPGSRITFHTSVYNHSEWRQNHLT
jgi:hypothetical protein